MAITSGFEATIRISLTIEQQRMPYSDAVAAMKAFLAEKLGPKAAEYEHVGVCDPGYAYFRRRTTGCGEE